MAAKPKDVDRKALELEYRAGIKSLRALGSEFGISGARVAQIAEELGWQRDLKERIRAATEAKLNAAILDTKLDVDKVEREEQVIEAVATKQTGVVRRQGERIEKLTTLADRLTDELVHQTENLDLYEKLGEIMDAADDSKAQEKLKIIYNKAMSSPGRIAAFRNLVETSKTLIGLERQNVGLADNANGEADAPEKEVPMSDQEAARRIAFMLTSAMQKGV